ncbi:MAG: TetR/AcrR family transcriptional regulator [Flammeovirgaceae bacterium]|nr:TetR/AcrR family transcriptional regulator [Flammeovirgaceae bacterium]
MENIDLKERITKGAEELFMKYGIRSVSMDDISHRLSVSKKTIYQYFRDKDEVVSVVTRLHLEQEEAEMEQIFTSSRNVIEELVNISICLRKNVSQINPSLLLDLRKYHPDGWSRWVDFKNNYIRKAVIRNVENGIKEGYFRPELNVEIVATIRLEHVQMGFDDQLFPKERFTLAEVHTQLFDLFAYGLLTEKGRNAFEQYKKKLEKENKVNQE